VTSVFFLFLLHLALGLLAMLPFVPDRAGRSFFKLCSAAAAFMMAAAAWSAYRRFGLDGAEGAPGADPGADPRLTPGAQRFGGSAASTPQRRSASMTAQFAPRPAGS